MKVFFVDLLATLLSFFRIRFVHFNVHRIGHLAVEFDCHVKMRQLNMLSKTFDIVYPAMSPIPANATLVEYWKPFFHFIKPEKKRKWRRLASHSKLKVDVSCYAEAMENNALYYQVQTKWDKRPPVLKLKKNHQVDGDDYLKRVGLSENDWFVCIHCREAGFAPNEDQEYRDSNIHSYALAIEAIVKRGGWVFRLGDPTMEKLPINYPHVIDYAHSADKSELLDLFLPARALFFLGSCSGLSGVAALFNVPVISVDLCPMSTLCHCTYRDLTLPKLHWSIKENRLLTFHEILNSPLANYRFKSDFDNAGVKLINNTPDDILDVTSEMFDRLNTQFYRFKDTELQAMVSQLFKPNHYSYGGQGKIGHRFLTNHKDLLNTTSGIKP